MLRKTKFLSQEPQRTSKMASAKQSRRHPVEKKIKIRKDFISIPLLKILFKLRTKISQCSLIIPINLFTEAINLRSTIIPLNHKR